MILYTIRHYQPLLIPASKYDLIANILDILRFEVMKILSFCLKKFFESWPRIIIVNNVGLRFKPSQIFSHCKQQNYRLILLLSFWDKSPKKVISVAMTQFFCMHYLKVHLHTHLNHAFFSLNLFFCRAYFGWLVVLPS